MRDVDLQASGAMAGAGPGNRTEVARLELLTADEVAARLRVPPSWVQKAARAGRIPSVPVGRYRRFRWADIEAWLEQGRARERRVGVPA